MPNDNPQAAHQMAAQAIKAITESARADASELLYATRALFGDASCPAPVTIKAGGGQVDIEITPGMIEAGFDVLLEYDRDDVQSRIVAAEVYRAMREIELRSQPG